MTLGSGAALMTTNTTDVPDPQADLPPTVLSRFWHDIRRRILGGLLLVLPFLITFWVVYWLYSGLKQVVIDPLAQLVLWQVQRVKPEASLPSWFESYAAPLIGILVALVLLYCLGFFVNSRLRRMLDSALLRLPGVSVVYNGVRQVLQTLDRQRARQRQQRVVLIPFPHPGMKVLAFVTATCRDIDTGKVILCVYVPTTPVPTSGYFLLIPEEEATEVNWTSEQSLQTIISAGLTAPPEVRYSRPGSAAAILPPSAPVTSAAPPQQQDGRPASL
jgi:uncharacterized membrane protein